MLSAFGWQRPRRGSGEIRRNRDAATIGGSLWVLSVLSSHLASRNRDADADGAAATAARCAGHARPPAIQASSPPATAGVQSVGGSHYSVLSASVCVEYSYRSGLPSASAHHSSLPPERAPSVHSRY